MTILANKLILIIYKVIHQHIKQTRFKMQQFIVNVEKSVTPVPDDPIDPTPDDPVVPDDSGESGTISGDTDGTIVAVPNTGQNSVEPSEIILMPEFILSLVFVIILLTTLAYRYFRRLKSPDFTSPKTPKSRASILGLSALLLISSFTSFTIIKNLSDNLNSASATEGTIDVSSLTESDSISVSTSDVALDFDLSDQDSVYQAVKNTVKVSTSTTFGYTLGVYTSDSALTNQDGDTIASVAAGSTAALDANTWGVATSQPQSAASTVWQGIPTSASSALILKSTGYQETAAGDATDLYFGAYLTPELPAGIYTSSTINYVAIANIPIETTIIFDANGGTGEMSDQTFYNHLGTILSTNTFTNTNLEFGSWNTQPDGSGQALANQAEVTDLQPDGGEITLYAQWVDCGPNKICYDANGAANISLSKQLTASNSGVTLWASNLQRAGYGFIGWSPDSAAASNLASATIYGPNQTITTDDLSMGGLKLYAVWLASSGDLQNWTCPNDVDFPIGSVTALTDQRDGNTYAVAKLADDNCWLIENLRLGGDTEMTLNSADTQTPGLLPASSSSWVIINSAAAKYLNDSNLQSSNQIITTNNTNIYSYGNYYTWSTAVNYDASTFGTIDSSICPAGWSLPGSLVGSFSSLDESFGGNGSSRYDTSAASTVWRTYPNNFVFSGSFGASAQDRGVAGFYWSQPSYDSTSAYHLSFTSTDIYFNNVQKGFGGSIRCLTDVKTE